MPRHGQRHKRDKPPWRSPTRRSLPRTVKLDGNAQRYIEEMNAPVVSEVSQLGTGVDAKRERAIEEMEEAT